MIPEASNFVTFLLEGVMSVMLIALLFYALRILTSFKKGMLERGWKLLSQGIVILVVGELIISLSNYQSAGGYLFQLGIGVDAIGVGLAVFGFKSHHDIWRMGKEYRDKDSAPTAEAKSV
ncbi:MAG TPA: hypothetical protein VN739_01435 [Nitrososphaerales archaeon]|nr:hypothetical protein [Nitrososphaerales archaeon]